MACKGIWVKNSIPLYKCILDYQCTECMRLENWNVIDEVLQELESSLQITDKSSIGWIIIYHGSFFKNF